MNKQRLITLSAIHAASVLVYITLVSLLMINVEEIFGGGPDGVFGPMLFLLLLVVSAAIVGILIFGRPVYLFMSGHKKQAVDFALYTVGMLIVITIAVFFLLATVGV